MMHVLLFGATAAAMGLVAHVTGSWGAGLWAMVLAPVSAVACLYDAHTRAQAGGSTA